MKETYHGSCYCGAVRFECELDLAEGTSKCNCSICTKTRFWKAVVEADAFRPLQGEDVLATGHFKNRQILLPLEAARIGSPLFIFADSPHDQIGSSSPIDTFATRLSAQALKLKKTTELTDERWRRIEPLLPTLRQGRGTLGPTAQKVVS